MRILLTLLFFLRLIVSLQAQSAQRPELVVTPLNKQVFVHTTYGMYGGTPFPSNGLIIKTEDGIVLVDTGWDTDTNTDNTRELLRWVSNNLHQPVRLCIVTHAHEDRVGGISELRKAGVRVVSTPLTAQKSIKLGFESPEAVLPNDTTFSIGNEPIRCYFPGQGHTPDNIVVWLPNQKILYGGCLVKSVAAFGMGNLTDANLNEWGNSIQNLMIQFKSARIVVPGHQEWTDTQSLAHTLQLLKKHGEAKK
ncbi:subclass B1 metallo-beta-lactamase [Spirosoma sp.]|uniref:subclass B1 metallo-beta-lactamase n=1 Tax=Spirosoma sp. TaxID=1899569 RepID=UPI00262E5625|nr:subclass B1 metallo-beta-lactamase [Spirosoma sp.]MCX6216927.1 subclass B1 metallo-beta-lactamase [Spirosoma sp.]